MVLDHCIDSMNSKLPTITYSFRTYLVLVSIGYLYRGTCWPVDRLGAKEVISGRSTERERKGVFVKDIYVYIYISNLSSGAVVGWVSWSFVRGGIKARD